MKKLKYFVFLLLTSLLFRSELNAQVTPVYTVLFTHIEDNSPAGIIGSAQCKQNYLLIRGRLVQLAQLMKSYQIKWSFEPDWKILLAALQYEDSTVMQTTNGKNFLKYFKENLNVAIDPHSHENQGFNYTDVAHLLDSLNVGGSKVIGGHIWDPSLPQFAAWDRFRVPVFGTKYPWSVWQGNILMGSGTPNHVNDPEISGIWRPQDRDHYFMDDPNGNIYCVGKYKDDISTVNELINLYKIQTVDTTCMLTISHHINLSEISAQNGFTNIENTILKPLDSLRKLNEVVLTDFTSLIDEWKTKFHENACIYDPAIPTSTNEYNSVNENKYLVYPNPITDHIHIQNTKGNEFLELMNVCQQNFWSGKNIEQEDFSNLIGGIYVLKVSCNNSIRTIKLVKI